MIDIKTLIKTRRATFSGGIVSAHADTAVLGSRAVVWIRDFDTNDDSSTRPLGF